MTAAAFALCYAGLVLLSLSQARQHRRVYGGDVDRRRRRWSLRAGWALLAASASVSAAGWGPGTGAVVLLGLATLAAVAVALLLTYAPRVVPWTGAAAAGVAVAAGAVVWATWESAP